MVTLAAMTVIGATLRFLNLIIGKGCQRGIGGLILAIINHNFNHGSLGRRDVNAI